MKGGIHLKHFGGAFKTLRHHKELWLIAPIAALVGSGALVDSTFQLVTGISDEVRGTSDLFTFILQTPPGIIVALLAIFILLSLLAIWMQCAIIHVTFKHSNRGKTHLAHAFQKSLPRFHAAVGIHAFSFILLALLAFIASVLLRRLLIVPPFWHVFSTILIYGTVIVSSLYVLMIKMVALQLAVGKKESSVEAIGRAVEIVHASPVAALEHTVGLATIGVVTVSAIAVVSIFLLRIFIPLGLFTSVDMYLQIIITLVGLLYLWLMGLLLVFNLSAWSRLTISLQRRAVTSRIRHTLRTFLPFV